MILWVFLWREGAEWVINRLQHLVSEIFCQTAEPQSLHLSFPSFISCRLCVYVTERANMLHFCVLSTLNACVSLCLCVCLGVGVCVCGCCPLLVMTGSSPETSLLRKEASHSDLQRVFIICYREGLWYFRQEMEQLAICHFRWSLLLQSEQTACRLKINQSCAMHYFFKAKSETLLSCSANLDCFSVASC